MNNEEVFNCPYPFGIYLEELTNDIIVVFDRDRKALRCNKRFLSLSDLGEDELKGKKMGDLFQLGEVDLTHLPKENSHQKTHMRVSDSLAGGSSYTFTVYLFNTGNYYYLIGKERGVEDREILEKISLLNNELSNKTRELTKKNKELEKANRKIEELSKTDPLTNLANRRRFMDYFQKMLAQAKRHSCPLSLIMIDLDKFKNINDTYGHSVGDQVLSTLGNLLEGETREEDLAARIGGEEFAVLLNQTDIEQARSYAERIRRKVSELELEDVPSQISASLGISCRRKGDTTESIMKRADSALYEAKEAGRNKVCKSL